MANRGSNKVVLEGRGAVTLSPASYVATGGEGSIYRINDTVVKLYTEPEKKRRAGTFEKIGLLAALKHPYVVAPQGIVTDTAGKVIGFYMPYVSGEALPRIFTNDFRRRESFGDLDAKTFAARMREVVLFAHGEKAVLVDANELNWLAIFEKGRKCEPRVIDVDSWAIDRWPGTVIMPSIRDWHTAGFTAASDWFAWGVVTFQIFTGIHPYKGGLDGYAPGDLEKRMKDRASIFHKGVRLNRAVRDFGCIPKQLRDWYEAMFERSEHSIPPSPLTAGAAIPAVARTLRITNTSSGALIFEKLFEQVNDAAVRFWPCGVVLLSSGKLFDLGTRREIGRLNSTRGEVVRKENGWLIADFDGGTPCPPSQVGACSGVAGGPKFSFVNAVSLAREPLGIGIKCKSFLRFENRLFAVTEQGLSELVVQYFAKPLLSLGASWNVFAQATQWFDGLGVEDALGATFLVLPFGEKALAHLRVPELDGIKVLTARSGADSAVCIGTDRYGRYQRFEFHFDNTRQTYKIWRSEVDSPELNTAFLPKGVSATIAEDHELLIFVPSNGNLNKVAERGITTEMTLANWENAVIYIQDGAIWRVRMR